VAKGGFLHRYRYAKRVAQRVLQLTQDMNGTPFGDRRRQRPLPLSRPPAEEPLPRRHLCLIDDCAEDGLSVPPRSALALGQTLLNLQGHSKQRVFDSFHRSDLQMNPRKKPAGTIPAGSTQLERFGSGGDGALDLHRRDGDAAPFGQPLFRGGGLAIDADEVIPRLAVGHFLAEQLADSGFFRDFDMVGEAATRIVDVENLREKYSFEKWSMIGTVVRGAELAVWSHPLS